MIHPLIRTISTSVLFTVISINFATAQDLQLTLNLRDGESGAAIIEFEETFEVIITNVSDKDIVVPDEPQLNRMAAISFRISVQGSNQPRLVFRKKETAEPDDQTVNEEPKTLAPSESLSLFPGLAFDRWGDQRWLNLPTPNLGNEYEIVARLEIEKLADEIWEGAIESKPAKFRFVFERGTTPHQYLWNGFPDAAMKLLKADPSLVNQKDEDQRTPLHVAARFNHPQVVQWLLENGAKVSPKAYNQFTPLHLSVDHAEVCDLLLKAGAEPHAKSAFGESPLQKVTAKLSEKWVQETPEQLTKWNAVLDAFLANGVQLDLISAIQLGRIKSVKELLTGNPELLNVSGRAQSPLRTAAKFGKQEIVQYLLTTFPDKMDVDDFAGGSGYPVTKEALPHPKVLKLLIDTGADLERRITWQGMRSGVWFIKDNATLLHFAARDGTPETIELLLKAGLDPFASTRKEDAQSSDQTALDVACLFGKTHLAKAILKSDAFQQGSANQRAQVLSRCLQYTCGRGLDRNQNDQADLLNALIENGADVTPNGREYSLIQSIAYGIHPNDTDINQTVRPLIDILLRHGVEMDLYSAVALRDQAAVKKILESDPKTSESRRADGYPAIHLAISCGELELVKALIAAGCDMDLKNHSKSTGSFAGRMIHVAAFWDQPEIAQFLIDSGAKVNVIAKEKVTPLHSAVYAGSHSMVQLLLENGADVHAQDLQGRTPLSRATNPRVKKLLRNWLEQNE
jgi:ankyrin repeat protein